MTLEVGMYVRFKDKNGCTYIRKVIDGYKEHWYGCKVDKNANNVPYVSDKNIINYSYNIIDLIEVGDYVNGKQVIETYYKSDEKWHLEIVDSRLLTHDELKHVNIQSIVTKEQFESMEYKK